MISDFQNPPKNVTSDDLYGVISRSRKWKWPVSSKWLLLGPVYLWAKMFTFAQLIKVHLDLWPCLTFRGHFKVMNVKIVYILLMVRDKHGVTMKHQWEVDTGLSESAKNDLGRPWRGHFKVTKVKMARIVLTVAPRPRVPKNKNVNHCPINKSASWP